METNYYSILNVSPDSNPKQIRDAFRNRILERFPEVEDKESSNNFLSLYTAYFILSDDQKRDKYDTSIKNKTNLSLIESWIEQADKLGKEHLGRFQNYRKNLRIDIVLYAIVPARIRPLFVSTALLMYGPFVIWKGCKGVEYTHIFSGLILMVVGVVLGMVVINYISNDHREILIKSVLQDNKEAL